MGEADSRSPAGRALVVDDEKNIVKTFRFCLEDAGYRVSAANNGAQALALIQQEVIDVCFLDLRLGDESGLDLIADLLAVAPWTKIVMITAYSSIENAVEAVRRGASDYLAKPCSPEQLRIAAQQQMALRRMESRLAALEDGSQPDPAANVLSSDSPAMMQVLETVRAVADTDATVLVRGESGTGKGAVARAIHALSPRAGSPFVGINCPSLSSELLESQLFGHKKGAFTGATENAPGRVSYAEGGTLFLDEIGDFPTPLQPKLLRFVQEREYERVGDPTTRRADVRLVAATNRDLDAMVASGSFRGDLLFRLNVIMIELPPLRERPEDIATLSRAFLTRFASAYARPAQGFSAEAGHALETYTWPGNVRELQNVIERSVILSKMPEIGLQELNMAPADVEHGGRLRVGDTVTLEDLERAQIQAIVASSDTLDSAAQTLGIDPSTLWRKRKQYGI
ncbi:MAG: sigma-54-dependent transcriptional regulator [Gammaproteobacteria bacterium]